METRVFILWLACMSSLVPPMLGSVHALKAVAIAKGALALKAAALGAVKGAAIKGAAVLAAKGAALKGAVALAAAKAASLAPHKLPAVQPVVIQEPAVVRYSVPTIVSSNPVVVRTSPPRVPSALNSLTALWSSAHGVLQKKVAAVGSALESLHQPSPAYVRAPVFYEYVEPARFYPAPVPLLDATDDCN